METKGSGTMEQNGQWKVRNQGSKLEKDFARGFGGGADRCWSKGTNDHI